MRRRLLVKGLAAVGAALAAPKLARGQGTPGAGTPVGSPEAATPVAEGGLASVNGIELSYEVHGSGAPLIMLHGGLATGELQFGQLVPILAQTRRVVLVDLQGHGRTADVDRPLAYETMADDVAGLIGLLGLGRADLFGYSLGGGVALQAAIRHPDAIGKMVVASAAFQRDGWYPEVNAATAGLNADVAAAMVATPLYEAYARVAPRPEDWPRLVTKIGQLLARDYDWSAAVAAIAAPTLLVYGDADSVRPEHATELFRLLGGGLPGDFAPLPADQLAVLPGTAHSAVTFRVDLLPPIVVPFLDAPPAGG